MLHQDELNRAVTHFATQGQSLYDAAMLLAQRYPQISLTELAVALRHMQPDQIMRRSVLAADADAASDDEVQAAIQLAEALKSARPNVTSSDIAQALHSPGVYPNLTAYQMGLVLKAPNVFPMITTAEMHTALGAAGYPQADIDSAIAQLFPTPQIVKIGPAGVQSMVFDDTDAAQSLKLPLTQIRVQHGNIVDGIQAFYGSGRTALAHHGGTGGGATDIPVDANDPITQISGFYGLWFGGNYILQLTIQTKNGRTHGPFGNMTFSTTPTPFSLAINPNQKVIALFGSVAYGNNGQAQFLGSIGISVSS